LNSSLSSKKCLLKIYRYLAILKINRVTLSGNTYTITITNDGYSMFKPTQLGLKAGKMLKKVSIKSMKALIPFANIKNKITVKITLPKKYVSEKYLKILKVDYYNKNKEISKKNSTLKFRLDYIPTDNIVN
jgi:hypothetical protein